MTQKPFPTSVPGIYVRPDGVRVEASGPFTISTTDRGKVVITGARIYSPLAPEHLTARDMAMACVEHLRLLVDRGS